MEPLSVGTIHGFFESWIVGLTGFGYQKTWMEITVDFVGEVICCQLNHPTLPIPPINIPVIPTPPIDRVGLTGILIGGIGRVG
jgi:hypothetical protein